MKKINRIIIALLALMLVFPLSFAVAEVDDYDYDSFSLEPDDAESILDYANLLSETELATLEERAAALENQYTIAVDNKSSKIGIYIITLPNKELIGAESYAIYELSEALYESWGLGVGDEKTGILLLMDMDERDFDILAHGTAGHYTFTDYGKEKLEEAFSDDFGVNDWYEGFSHYLDAIERELMWAEKGEPVDVNSESEMLRTKIGIPGIVGIAFLIGIILAFIVCGYFKAQMKSVHAAASASDFVIKNGKNGITYTEKVDKFVNTTTVTRTIESSSSKGGTSVNSSGYSHHSGKF